MDPQNQSSELAETLAQHPPYSTEISSILYTIGRS